MQLLPITDEIKNGEPVLMKFRSDIRAKFCPDGDRDDLAHFEGIWAVMFNRGRDEYDSWAFDAPVGRGGFPDAWFEGWMPLPGAGGYLVETIDITTEHDSADCETCGSNWDEGGDAMVNGKPVFSYKPVASCWGNANYEWSDLLVLALDKLGIKITVDGGAPYSLTKYSPESD